jgi:aldose sugar dehydrogenase
MKRVAIALLFPFAALAQTAEDFATGLQRPWAMTQLPDVSWLVTEKAGRLLPVDANGRVGAPIEGLPKSEDTGQGGLHDVVAARDFARSRLLFLCFNEAGEGGLNGTAMARARLSDDGKKLEGVRVIFRQQPKMKGRHHFGCRIAERADGTLFLALGDRYQGMQRAQTLDSHLGKVVRVTQDGAAPPDNPFVGQKGALPEIWSYGHRNAQGALLDAQGRLFVHEHGPQGGDEINRIEPGKNYGWPVITYGEDYGGGRIGDGITRKDGLEQPLIHWTPSIAPSGFALLGSERYGKAWQGSFFVGSLKFRRLERVQFDATGKLVAQQPLLEGLGRVRDVRQGQDGLLYLLVESEPARIVRVLP